jgi:hypothetical protein
MSTDGRPKVRKGYVGDYQSFASWLLCGLLGGCAVYGVGVLAKLTASIQQLNGQIARILEKTAWHEKELERLDDRVSRVEDNQ